jgi:hypothetical protein
LPITATVPPGEVRMFKLLVELAQRYEPLKEKGRAKLLARLRGVKPIFEHLT